MAFGALVVVVGALTQPVGGEEGELMGRAIAVLFGGGVLFAIGAEVGFVWLMKAIG
jgi:hypothetical protein